METFTTADSVKVGDIIQCVCEQGCKKAGSCQNFCQKGNSCNTAPQGTWEKVLHIHYQPALQNNWIYFNLTNNREFGAWSKTEIIKWV